MEKNKKKIFDIIILVIISLVALLIFWGFIDNFTFTPKVAKKYLSKLNEVEIVDFDGYGDPGDYHIRATIKIKNTDKIIEIRGIEKNYFKRTDQLYISRIGDIEIFGKYFDLKEKVTFGGFLSINIADKRYNDLFKIKTANIYDLINNYDKIYNYLNEVSLQSLYPVRIELLNYINESGHKEIVYIRKIKWQAE